MSSLSDAITASLEKHEIPVSDEGAQRVICWAEEAQRHGRRTNLIGMFEPTRIAEELVADSLQVLHLLPETPTSLIDIGAGAGVPGLILAGATGAHARLVEPRAKRTMFLKHAARAMGLSSSTRVFEARLEELPVDALDLEGSRLWVSRAVFAPELWLALAAEHGRQGDLVALWCNEHVARSSLKVPAALEDLGERRYSIRGPGDRTVFLFTHVGSTFAEVSA